jgi:threonine/homoserine/homoserine lactone efflux protein
MSAVADAFCATRFDGDWGRAFGTMPKGLDTQAIVDRAYSGRISQLEHETMQAGTMLVFAATVMPLVCTPGPDILFVASQGLSRGPRAAIRANLGVLLGYSMHALLAAFGVAALVAASPELFEILRWVGAAYLAYLAMKLIRSAIHPGQLSLAETPGYALVRRGFLTSFLNPKGLMVYFAILPNFMTSGDDVAFQAAVLSAIFIALCGIIYSAVGIVVSSVAQRGSFSDRRRRYVEGAAGALLIFAAGRLAVN